MASIYTHNKFGIKVRDRLPENLNKLAYKYEKQYLLGNQGPDIFFFNTSFLIKNIKIGAEIHYNSFESYIERNLELIQKEGFDSPITSYFLGSICHFILDSKVHPRINSLSTVSYNHLDIETEFDRYHMIEDKVDPKNFRQSSLIDASIYEDVQPLYASYNLSLEDVESSIKDFIFWKDVFHSETDFKINTISSALDLVGLKSTFGGVIMKDEPFEQAERTNKILLSHYNLALEDAPRLIENVFSHIFTKEKLEVNFKYNFNGELPKK